MPKLATVAFMLQFLFMIDIMSSSALFVTFSHLRHINNLFNKQTDKTVLIAFPLFTQSRSLYKEPEGSPEEQEVLQRALAFSSKREVLDALVAQKVGQHQKKIFESYNSIFFCSGEEEGFSFFYP